MQENNFFFLFWASAGTRKGIRYMQENKSGFNCIIQCYIILATENIAE